MNVQADIKPGTKFYTVLVDYGPKNSDTDQVFGLHGYSYRVGTADGERYVMETFHRNADEYPTAIVRTDRFYYGDVTSEFHDEDF